MASALAGDPDAGAAAEDGRRDARAWLGVAAFSGSAGEEEGIRGAIWLEAMKASGER